MYFLFKQLIISILILEYNKVCILCTHYFWQTHCFLVILQNYKMQRLC